MESLPNVPVSQAVEPSPKRWIMGVDLEGCSHHLGDPVVAVAMVVVDEATKQVVERTCVNFVRRWPCYNEQGVIWDYGDFDAVCWRDHWAKLVAADPKFVNRFTRFARTEAEGWGEVAAFLANVNRHAAARGAEIEFASDCPPFDIGAIDVHLAKHLSLPYMRYSPTGKFRNVWCTDTMLSHFTKNTQDVIKETVSKKVQHTHDPLDDAHYHAMMYFECRDAIALLEKSQQFGVAYFPAAKE